MNLWWPIQTHARKFPHKVAIVTDQTRLSYAELAARTARLSRALVTAGLTKGSFLAWLIGNRQEHLELLLACARAGVIAVPLDPLWNRTELEDYLSRFPVQGLVLEGSHQRDLLADRFLTTLEGRLFSLHPGVPGCMSYEELLARGNEVNDAELPAADTDDVFCLAITSGSTGKSKAIVLTHGNMLTRFLAQIVEFGFGHDDTYLSATPLYHGGGRSYTLNHLFVGGTIILHDRFDTRRVLLALSQDGVTTTFLVPTQLSRLLQEPDLERYHATTLRALLSSGSVLQPSVREGILRHLTPNLYEVYAATEVGSIAVRTPRSNDSSPSPSGQLVGSLEVRIVDDAGEPLPPGQTGEVICRGDGVSPGYQGATAEEAAAFREGWYHTGDLAYVDENGNLFLVGRKKDMIISGGKNIFAAEVEGVLMSHPGVAEAAVVGGPDPEWGEAVVAYVVPRPGSTLGANQLIEHCRTRMASYKKPRRVFIVESLPKLSSGKIDKRALRAPLWEGLTRQIG